VNAFAQVKLCLEGGLNLSDISYSGILETGPNGQRTGGILGVSFEFYTSKGFSLQFGARIIQKGCTYTNNAVEIIERIDYLEVPFIANLKFRTGRFEPFISAGIYYSARISGTQVQKYNSGENYEYDMNELYDNSDFGGLAGGGLEFKISKKFNLFLSASYSLGIINNLADDRFGSAYNKGIQLITGIKFTL
jgi:hypothetical protein